MNKSEIFDLLGNDSKAKLIGWPNLGLLLNSLATADYDSASEWIELLSETGYISADEKTALDNMVDQKKAAPVVSESTSISYDSPQLISSYHSETGWVAVFKFAAGNSVNVVADVEKEPTTSEWNARLQVLLNSIGGGTDGN